MRTYVATGLVAVLGLVPATASAEVWLDVEPYAAAATSTYESVLEFVEDQIVLSFAGDARRTVHVRTDDGDILVDQGLEGSPGQEVRVVIEEATWDRWAPGFKRRILEEIGRRLGMIVTAYKARVLKSHNPDLQDETLLAQLEIDIASLPESFAAKHLLSPFVVANAGRETAVQGPNCWHASIAAVCEGFEVPRRMSEAEFARQLTRMFQPIDEPEQLGDLVRLRDDEGRDVHAFIYVGRDFTMPERRIVFTKNGMTPGAYLFMDYESVLELYPDSELSCYRRRMRDTAAEDMDE